MSEEIDEIEALLPWYAAGALSGAQRRRVEAALAMRPPLQASLAAIEEERGETIALNEAVGAPSPDVWARVMQGVAAAPRRPPLSARLAAWLGSGTEPRARLVALGVAAALVIAVQAATIVKLVRSSGPKPTYGTAAAASSSADALIAFAPEATLADLTALLKANQATVVGGPRAGGLYELKIGGKPPSRAEIEAVVKTLSASPIVKMALPGPSR